MIQKIIAVIIFSTLFLIIGLITLDKIETNECQTWQAINRKDFDTKAFDTWQIDQCKAQGINLNIHQ